MSETSSETVAPEPIVVDGRKPGSGSTLEERIASLETAIHTHTSNLNTIMDLLNKINGTLQPALEKLGNSSMGRMLGL